MDILLYLIPYALLAGLVMLVVCIWCFKSGQYDDLSGDARRILQDDPIDPPHEKQNKQTQGKTDT